MIFRKKNKFTNEISFRQPIGSSPNPARGWYRIFPFSLPKRPDFKELEYCLNPQESLVLVRICIQQYQKIPLDCEALSILTDILNFFKIHHKEMILRIVYDQDGNGFMHEPSSIALVKTHIHQIGEVIEPFALSILTTQGIFVGSWGEMHTSRYLNPSDMTELVLCLYQATKGSVPMALRTPVQLRLLQKELQTVSTPTVYSDILRLTGLFNDGMTASKTDFGTYGESACADSADKWERREELKFQNQICQTVLNGGEVVNPNPYNDSQNAIQTLKMMHVTYLNSQYDAAVLEKWKSDFITSSEGTLSVYDYISTHLGYCMMLMDAKLNKHNPFQLLVFVSNTGFASLYRKVRLKITAKHTAHDSIVLYSEPSNSILPETTRCFVCSLEALETGEYHLSCCLEQETDHREISFYNTGDLGTLILR